ncbi:cupin domain-containing protein [Campylobacter armoricus]|uniref:cupin domain-containing protein n=2 Tax=Campylobacter armoricus TaxID=2505970 RepID=UPI001F322C9F|nr:cupin domain-containing protein [Campylobacter armoricus]
MEFKTQIYKVISWEQEIQNGINVFKKIENNYTKEICISMSKDSFMKDHKAPFDIVIQILKGSINFGVSNQQILLKTLDSISLKANETHNLLALEDSIIRLTLYKQDSFRRIENILKS